MRRLVGLQLRLGIRGIWIYSEGCRLLNFTLTCTRRVESYVLSYEASGMDVG